MNDWKLEQKQSLPLDAKVLIAKKRIEEWYEEHEGNVYISFSGGKDSTVLLHLVRSIYPDVKAVFSDTGLEYPEIKEFVKAFDNVDVVRPEKSFKQVIEDEGFPIISKKVARQLRDLQNPTESNFNTRKLYLTGIKRDGTRSKSFKLANKWRYMIDAPFKISEKCCDVMKKKPLKEYEKQHGVKAYVGTMASDSQQRRASYNKTGCNALKLGKSMPLSIWLEEDIWEYIEINNLEYCSIYNTGIKRTGCVFCMFGCHLEKSPNRFEQLKNTHPKLHRYCMYELGLKEVLEYANIKTGLEGTHLGFL